MKLSLHNFAALENYVQKVISAYPGDPQEHPLCPSSSDYSPRPTVLAIHLRLFPASSHSAVSASMFLNMKMDKSRRSETMHLPQDLLLPWSRDDYAPLPNTWQRISPTTPSTCTRSLETAMTVSRVFTSHSVILPPQDGRVICILHWCSSQPPKHLEFLVWQCRQGSHEDRLSLPHCLHPRPYLTQSSSSWRISSMLRTWMTESLTSPRISTWWRRTTYPLWSYRSVYRCVQQAY